MEILIYFMIGFCARDMYSWLKEKLQYTMEINLLQDLWIDDYDTEWEEEA